MKILLVDDSRAVGAVLGARLVAIGHTVVFAENGLQAVEHFTAMPPDLVLMDIEMPVMDGFEAVRRIRDLERQGEWAWTPVIFLTASDTPENLITAIEAGADDFLAKALPEGVLEAKMKAMERMAHLRAELAEANHKLEVQARMDGLTGLYNRRYMDARLDRLWAEAVQRQASFGLLMIDVDHFKKYNDHYGHLAGDECLQTVARLLADVVAKANEVGLTSQAFVARYGGEEFAVLLPNCSERVQHKVAEAIVTATRGLGIPHEKSADWGGVTLSVGGARVERADGLLSPLFRRADLSLYRAKQNGRNRFEMAGPEAPQ